MRKTKRIITMAVSVLLILVLVTSAGLSSTMAKYVASKKTVTSNTGTVAKWGINITPGTHLNTHYTDMGNGTYKVQTTGTTNMLAPGTKGGLAYIKFSGTPEVAYKIDISGSINIGYGFWSVENAFKHKREKMYPTLEREGTDKEIHDAITELTKIDITGLTAKEYNALTKEQQTAKTEEKLKAELKTELGDTKYNALTAEQLKAKVSEKLASKVTAKTNAINAYVLNQPDIKAKYEVLLRDEKGREIDYFPIAIYLCRYDYDANGNETRNVLSRHCVVRLTPDSPVGMIPALSGDETVADKLQDAGEETATAGNVDTRYRMSFFSTVSSTDNNEILSKRWASVANMQAGFGDNTKYSVNKALDKTYTPGTIRSTYVVEWEWAHNVENGPTNKDIANYEKTRNGNTYRYQTSDLDTQLGEAMMKHPELFNISVELSAVVNQVKTLS